MSQQPNVSPDALTSAENTRKVLLLSQSKTAMPWRTQLPLAFLAGLYIGFGGLFCTLFASDTTLPFALQKFLSGVVFSLGLFLVLVAGAELYTGNTMIAAGASEGLISWKATLMNWVRVWLGNLLGALTLVFLVSQAHVADMGNMAYGMMSIASGKLSANWMTIFFKGILCNLLVCLGVWVGYAGRTVVDKCLGVILPVAAFVALGFEHCVANMYFLPLAFSLV
ncbi:Formate/nitrite transporter, partial [gut metagenome]